MCGFLFASVRSHQRAFAGPAGIYIYIYNSYMDTLNQTSLMGKCYEYRCHGIVCTRGRNGNVQTAGNVSIMCVCLAVMIQLCLVTVYTFPCTVLAQACLGSKTINLRCYNKICERCVI